MPKATTAFSNRGRDDIMLNKQALENPNLTKYNPVYGKTLSIKKHNG